MTNSQDEEIRLLCKELAFKGVRLSPINDWLVSCVNCFRDEVKSPGQYTPSELYQFVYEQWLLADLNEVASPSLPASSLASSPHIVGRFAVQMNYALNVAVSCHKQYQKLCRPEAESNLEVDVEGKREKESNEVRMLKFELTDGVTTVIGFEDKPITCIEDPTPGEKLLLKGKIEVRKGILMLNGGNVELLGGEVDTLLIPNATVNVLARKLGLPENPQPYGRADSEHPSHETSVIDPIENGEDENEILRHVEMLESQIMSRRATVSTTNSSSTTTTSNHRTSVNTLNSRPTGATISNSRPSGSTTNPKTQPSSAKPNHRSHPTTSTSKTSTSNSHSNRSAVQSKMTNFLTQPTSHTNVNSFDFADDFDDIDIDAVDSVLNKIESPPDNAKKSAKPVKTSTSYANQFDDDDDFTFSSSYFDNSVKKPSSSFTAFKTKASHVVQNDSGNRNRLNQMSGASTTSYADDFDDIDVDAIDSVLKHIESPRDTVKKPAQSVKRPVESLKNTSSFVQPENMFNQFDDDDDIIFSSTNFNNSFPSQSAIAPTVDLSETNPKSCLSTSQIPEEWPPKKFPCERKTQAQVTGLIGKLKMADGQFHLSAKIKCHGHEFDVNFSPQVLDKVFCLTAAEVLAKKHEANRNVQVKENLNQQLKQSQLKISTLSGKMIIKFERVSDRPIVVDIIE